MTPHDQNTKEEEQTGTKLTKRQQKRRQNITTLAVVVCSNILTDISSLLLTPRPFRWLLFHSSCCCSNTCGYGCQFNAALQCPFNPTLSSTPTPVQHQTQMQHNSIAPLLVCRRRHTHYHRHNAHTSNKTNLAGLLCSNPSFRQMKLLLYTYKHHSSSHTTNTMCHSTCNNTLLLCTPTQQSSSQTTHNCRSAFKASIPHAHQS